MALDIKQLIEDESADRDYFAMVPAMLWPDIKLCSKGSDADAAAAHAQELGISLNVHDRWLYVTLKKICGEKGGQCFMSSRGLAKFAGMSTGQLSKSKAKLEQAGLITIIAKKRSIKGWAIDHIKVVDVWEQNIRLIKVRQQSAHQVNTSEEEKCSGDEPIRSPGERIEPKCSPHEPKCSPSETEEEPIEEEPKGEEKSEKKTNFPFPENPDDEPLDAGTDLYWQHCQTAKANQDAIGNYAVPPSAGGDDPLAECALSCFCAMQHEAPNEDERYNMLLEFSETLKPLKPTAEEVETAFDIMARDFKYRVGNYNPFQDSFKRDLATCIRRARAEIDKCAEVEAARHARAEARNAEALAALKERQAAKPPPVEGDWAWEAAKRELQLQADKHTFETWVANTVGLGREDGVYTVAAPDALTRDWLESRLEETAERTLVGILDEAVEVRFEEVES